MTGLHKLVYIKGVVQMMKDMLIMRDPLKLIGSETTQRIKPGSFAAIMARAGVGKTALLVQIALNGMLKDKNVLHISTEDPVDKVSLWYQEVFQRLTQEYEAVEANKLWDQLLKHRFIMTFETESFSIAKLKKRVDELISQNIFNPAQIMIDGFAFESTSEIELAELKKFAEDNDLIFWFTVRTHRDEPTGDSNLPASLVSVAKMFDLMIRLQPDKDRIYLRRITRSGDEVSHDNPELYLDPSTLLIRETAE